MLSAKKIILLIFVTLLVFESWAQRGRGGPADREKLEAAKVAFITKKLDLSPEQAEKFWPLFNQHDQKRRQHMKAIHQLGREAEEGVSDQRAKELISKRFELQEKILQQEKAFIQSLEGILSPMQALRLHEANREFTRQIYRMQGRGRSGPKGN
ncbi:periplasmic heavy metal sensor [Pleomorphovibrio marinus]|uniref:periplasmic heavy metal sensor n=1 Tax=Pleomorphovibrio marinus TaxID=2164132 RepID=UPI000E0BF2FA|nr:periplasmic heavy metal sensor [Pleomorphovibrio marinus]